MCYSQADNDPQYYALAGDSEYDDYSFEYESSLHTDWDVDLNESLEDESEFFNFTLLCCLIPEDSPRFNYPYCILSGKRLDIPF